MRAAVGGVPGPASLGIPADWFSKRLGSAPDLYAESPFAKVGALRGAPVARDIERAIALITSAAKPVILAGGGVMLSEAWHELTALAETLNVPVVTTMAGKGSIADAHPLSVGAAGRYSRKVANDTLRAADFCLAIGTRLGATGTDVFKVPRKGAKIVHIDLDPHSLGRTYREEVSIIADARTALVMLAEAARSSKVNGSRWSDWTKEVQGNVPSWNKDGESFSREPVLQGRINPHHVMRLLDQYLRGDDMIVADTGYMAAWAVTVLQQKQPGRNTLRAAGMGASYGFGGIGKIIGSLGPALIAGSSNTVRPAASVAKIVPSFIYLASWFALAGVVYLLFGIETRRRPFEEIEGELI